MRASWISLIVLATVVLGMSCGRDGTKPSKPTTWNTLGARLPRGWTWQKGCQKQHAGPGFIARKDLRTLRSGASGAGEGGLLLFGTAEAGLAHKLQEEGAVAVRELLRRDFEAESLLRSERFALLDGTRATELNLAGSAENLKGKRAPCHAMFLAADVEGVGRYVAIYVWPTEHDVEGLSDDVDFLATQADFLLGIVSAE